MEQKYAICYVSNISENIDENEVDNILLDSQRNNKEKDITGVLLYSDGNFFQILEGEEQKVKDLFSVIKEDSRHKGILTIFQKKIMKFTYDGYVSDFVTAKTKLREDVQQYMKHITTADPQTRNTIEKILKMFVSPN